MTGTRQFLRYLHYKGLTEYRSFAGRSDSGALVPLDPAETSAGSTSAASLAPL